MYYLIIYTLVIYTLVINLYLAIPQSQVQKMFAQHSTFGIKLEIDNKFLDYAYKSAGTVLLASGSAESGAASEAEMRAAKTAAAVKEQAKARRAAEAKAKAKAMAKAKAKAKAKASEKEDRRLLAEAAKVAKAAAEAEAEAKQEQQQNGGETGALSVAGVKVRTHPPFAHRISSDMITVCCLPLLLTAGSLPVLGRTVGRVGEGYGCCASQAAAAATRGQHGAGGEACRGRCQVQ